MIALLMDKRDALEAEIAAAHKALEPYADDQSCTDKSLAARFKRVIDAMSRLQAGAHAQAHAALTEAGAPEGKLSERIAWLQAQRAEAEARYTRMLLTNDEIIDVRDALLAKGDIAALSVEDQNLFRDCDIALGVVRCQPETREEARGRVTRAKGM